MLNISLSCPGLSYHYHPSKTRSWNLNPASYAICQGSWMMKGQREIYRRRRKGQREHHIIVHMAAAGGSKKKRLGAFFAFDEALESLVSIPSTHTHWCLQNPKTSPPAHQSLIWEKIPLQFFKKPIMAMSHTLIWKAILDPNFHRIDNTNFQISVLKICVKSSKINEFQA